MSNKKRILLRADANSKIGTGHVFRLLALAEILKFKYEVLFCTQTTNYHLLGKIGNHVDKIIELPNQFEYCLPSEKLLNAEMPYDLKNVLKSDDIVVTDGYWFRENYQKMVLKTGAKLVMIDDFANQHFYAHTVINHAPGLLESNFKGEEHTNFYLGLKYALIRKDFFDFTFTQRTQIPKSILVSFGGSDPFNLILPYTQALLKNTNLQIHLLSSDFLQTETINSIDVLKDLNCNRLSIYKNLESKDLKSLLDNCNYALVPSSTILLECLASGVICITGYYTENQFLIYNGIIKETYAEGLGDLRNYNINKLHKVVDRAEKCSTPNILESSISNIIKIFDDLC